MQPAGHAEVGGAADQLMRRLLNEVDGLRARVERNGEEIRKLREDVRRALADAEMEARRHVSAFTPRDLGESLRLDLAHAFAEEDVPARRAPLPAPTSFDQAQEEWEGIANIAEEECTAVIQAKRRWDAKVFKNRRTKPIIPSKLWEATERLSEIHAVLPVLRESFVTERLDSKAHLNVDLAREVERRMREMEEATATSAEVLEAAEGETDLTGASWGDPGWLEVVPAAALQRVIRAGEIAPPLPASCGIERIPLLLSHPLSASIAIATGIERRQEGIELARSLALRSLAATPPGDLRFVFVDPVSLGQSVSDFRHLAEFDSRLVDTKTWTSGREIEAKLDELAAHIEVVISTYLRGQFDSIDAYNRQAGEVAEPYITLVVFDYPTGFSTAAARQFLSLIENGARCGIHVILHHDPGAESVEEVPLARLTHSMQSVDLTTPRGRVSFPDPIGAIDADFFPDAAPPAAFSPDGRPETPTAQLLLEVGAASRSVDAGQVTIARVMPILNELVATRRSEQLPEVRPGASGIDPADSSTWWNAGSQGGAYAPIGRSGARDLASLYFSSTEIAGGAIMVGLPRSGKSTALHAAIVSMSMIYPPEELELYLVDSKHGVEFKIYERLPHARLVSINSEREFSVNVLQSLDNEIKHRAELMKGEAAGWANITEYRATTGKAMPRIVVIMDEFHELFEEDDALGQAAFRAFSNIVRQGPFAGVHLVVASQTLSSMPAMDRSTLSLLPMRVAFMCNEFDADLVMGDLNRDARSLSEQGEGIFNPARGEPSHNKPFRGTYIPPDARAALLDEVIAKATERGLSRTPRVFDGDTPAKRPSECPEPSLTRPTFALGEPFDLDPFAGVTLRRARCANVLLLGPAGEDEDSDVAVAAAAHSFIVGAIGNGMAAEVFDFIGDTEPTQGLDLSGLCDLAGARYRRDSGLAAGLDEILGEVSSRRDAEEYRQPGALLLLNGAHRAFDLVPEDPFADAEDASQPGALLARIAREGPEVGFHTALVVDSVAQFERKLGRDLLGEFGWCVTGSEASAGDLATITEVFNAPEIRPNQLLIADRSAGKQRRARAYTRLDNESLPTNLERRDT